MIKIKISIALLVVLSQFFFTDNLVERFTCKAASKEAEVYSSASVQMYFYIKKYAKEFRIPEAYAFSLAYQETRYQGPMDLRYNQAQTSFAGALGPMQVMPSTAEMIYGKKVSNHRLLTDVKLNVFISMKLLRRLHNQYKNWGLVFGAYNTGRPCINEYATNILNKKYFWIKKF